MSSLIEQRKEELASHIRQEMSAVQYFILNKRNSEGAVSIAQYLEVNKHRLRRIEEGLRVIQEGFNPRAQHFEAFADCMQRLKDLQQEISELQKRGENKLSNLQYLPAIKVLMTLGLSCIYIWVWFLYWDWLKESGWHYLTLIVAWPYLPCFPFLVLLFCIEEHSWSFPRRFLSEMLLAD